MGLNSAVALAVFRSFALLRLPCRCCCCCLLTFVGLRTLRRGGEAKRGGVGAGTREWKVSPFSVADAVAANELDGVGDARESTDEKTDFVFCLAAVAMMVGEDKRWK